MKTTATTFARLLILNLPLLSCLAAYEYQPPTAIAPLREVTVAVPYEQTWQAVIEVFAQNQIPIKTIDRASGLLVAEPLRFNLRNFSSSYTGKMGSLVTSDYEYADCGHSAAIKYNPTFARFNAQIRQKGDSSVLRVNVLYEWTPQTNLERQYENQLERKICVSTGKWENEVIEFIVRRTQ